VWTPADLDKFEERRPIGTKAHLALGLLQYLGVRRSDVAQIGRQHEKGGKIVYRMHKGAETGEHAAADAAHHQRAAANHRRQPLPGSGLSGDGAGQAAHGSRVRQLVP
jgi:hypothetical protein